MNHFQETPNTTVKQLVWELLQKINPHGKGCCYMHIGLQVLQQCISGMSVRECHLELQPYGGWQCEECFALNEDNPCVSDRMCGACLCSPPVSEDSEDPEDSEEAPSCEADVESLSAGTDSNSLAGAE